MFRRCAACHTLEPGVHRTGPSLAGVFGRKAGTAEGFHRYSDALRSADLVWREDTLNGFLADPQAFLPGNRMTFPGIADAQARADVIAYLKDTTELAAGAALRRRDGGRHDGRTRAADLKSIGPKARSRRSATAATPTTVRRSTGRRSRSGSSTCASRPIPATKGRRGRPALMPASMMGDRAS